MRYLLSRIAAFKATDGRAAESVRMSMLGLFRLKEHNKQGWLFGVFIKTGKYCAGKNLLTLDRTMLDPPLIHTLTR